MHANKIVDNRILGGRKDNIGVASFFGIVCVCGGGARPPK